MNDKINELYNKIDAQDNMINQQILEIASLKEEIKELNDDNAWWQRRFNAEHRIAFEEFKPRIDKAIEYIKEKQIQNEYTDRCGFRVKENKWWLEDSDILLEILGDKENG